MGRLSSAGAIRTVNDLFLPPPAASKGACAGSYSSIYTDDTNNGGSYKQLVLISLEEQTKHGSASLGVLEQKS